MVQSVRRQTAYLCTVRDVVSGEYVKNDGWDPNYLVSRGKAFVRVRIVGVIVEVLSPQHVILDDGSGRIALRSFHSSFSAGVGDRVMVIGRPREFNGERYVVVEIMSSLSPEWLQYFVSVRDAFQRFVPPAPARDEKGSEEEVVVDAHRNKAEVLLSLVRELDPGDGAPVDVVVERAGFPDAHDRLRFLIEEGEVFELRPGKIKVLE